MCRALTKGRFKVNKKELTPREKNFCRLYLNCADAFCAAREAGYKKSAREKGEELLSRADICEEIDRLSKLRRKTGTRLAQAGYRRLAFGSICDAVSLLYMDNPGEGELKKMDLFCVSEIKRPKDGSMEIKFFDRLKALEKLEKGAEDEAGAANIYDAINSASLALKNGEEKENEV